MDTIVFDIETKQLIEKFDGKPQLDRLDISAVCLYSYVRDQYECFTENDLDALKELLSKKTLLVGFSSNKFDIPVLSRHLDLDLFRYPRFDISDEIELRTGRLIGLNALGEINLGEAKTSTGAHAPTLYAEGKIEELLTYCKQDVRITKDLYDQIRKTGELLIPTNASPEPEVVTFDLLDSASVFI